MGKAKRAVDAQKSNEEKTAGSSALVRMVAGMCSHPECIIKANVEASMKGEAAGRHKPSDELPILTECTFKDCDAGGQIHSECFARLERTRSHSPTRP